MHVAIYIKKENLNTGNISLQPDVVDAYAKGLVTGLDIFIKETKEFLETYYGQGLDDLMGTCQSYGGYFIAKRIYQNNSKDVV
jgi:hypothetical protein